jgi:hypothetical protein
MSKGSDMKLHSSFHAMLALGLGLACSSLATAQSEPNPATRPAVTPTQFDALVRSLDKNGDGKITEEEARGAPWFGRVDRNGDGVLNSNELDALRKARGGANANPTPAPNSTAASTLYTSPDGFTPDAPFVGELGGGYGDPEFNDTIHQVVFQDGQNRVWIGDIDPKTGLFKTPTGRDFLMDENINVIFDRPPRGRKFSTNGPEWTRDAQGHFVVYTKEDAQGVMHQWMARLVEGKSVVKQLTQGDIDCFGNMPSRFHDGQPPRLSFTYDWPFPKAKAAWIFIDKPDEWHKIPSFDAKLMSMWSAFSPQFLFIQRLPGASVGQAALADAATGDIVVLTDDNGDKNDAQLFNAPEFGGERLLLCNVDNSFLAIYRDEKRDGKSPWKRFATLSLPSDSPFKHIVSPEVIASATGIGGVSYFALLARIEKDRTSEGSIWVLGLGTDPKNRLIRRVDDGSVTGTHASVLEPEPFVGKNEAYVYYNYFDRAGGKTGLRRAATGIKVPDSTSETTVEISTEPDEKKSIALFQRAELAGLTDTAVAVNGFAIADLNRDGMPDVIAARQVRTTFFARPGQELPHDRLDVLINRGDMKFEPHTIKVVGSDLSPERFGASAEVPNLVDFNGDGFLDIFITRSGGKKLQPHGNTLLLSQGAWNTFRDVSAAMGIQNFDGYNRQSSIADVNGDGWLDVAIGCDTIGRPDRYGAPHGRLFVFQPTGNSFVDGRFEDIAGTLGLEEFGGYTGDTTRDKAGPCVSLRDLDNDGDLDLVQTYHADMTGAMQSDREAAGNYAQGVWVWKNLLRETGEFRFQRVTDNGLAEYAKLHWNAEKQFYEASASGSGLPYFAFADADNDGLLDMLAIGPNSTYWAPRAEYTGGRFWKNLGGFNFELTTEKAGLASLDWNYKQVYEHNGWPLNPRMRDTSPRKAAGPQHKQPGLPSFGPGGNHPYFADVIFGDFDNDGWQDVVCLDRAELAGLNTFAHYYRNDQGTFRLLKTADTGLDASGISGEAADLNGDGLLDLIFAADPMNSSVGRKPEPDRFQSKVFLNNGEHGANANHWLHLTFTGLKDAEFVGARIEITADGKSQYRWIYSNHSYKSGGALDAHFGLGKAAAADVKVTLTDGRSQSFQNIQANQNHSLRFEKKQ